MTAAARTRYEVVPTGICWEITRDSKDFLAVQTKQVALDEAVYQASRNQPSHVVVKRLDGGVEDEASFGDLPSTGELTLVGSLRLDAAPPHRDVPRKAAS